MNDGPALHGHWLCRYPDGPYMNGGPFGCPHRGPHRRPHDGPYDGLHGCPLHGSQGGPHDDPHGGSMYDIIPTQCGGPLRPWRPQDDPLCPPCLASRQSGRPASSSVAASSLLSPDTASISGFMLSIDYRCVSILFDCTSLLAAVLVIAAVSSVVLLLLSN